MTNQQTQTYLTNDDDKHFIQRKNIQNLKSVITPDPQIKISDSEDNTLIKKDSKLWHYPRRERRASQYLNHYIMNAENDIN